MTERTSRTSIDVDLGSPIEGLERRSWTAVREHAMRDWSKRQPARTSETRTSDYSHIERPMAFGYAARTRYAERAAWDDELEGRLKEDWERSSPRARGDWEHVKNYVRHGWEYRQRMRS